METMQIILRDGHYHVKTNNAYMAEFFGANTIPTPFTNQTPLGVVLEKIKALNPDAHVFS
jgi:hypothetical protein